MKEMKLQRNKTKNNHQGLRILYLIKGAYWWGILIGRKEANQLSVDKIIKQLCWRKGEASCTQESLRS